MRLTFALFLVLFSVPAFAQTVIDSTKILKEVIIKGSRKQTDISRLDSVKGAFIYSGKKNEVINLNTRDAAITEKYGRQIFAKVPGVFVYDMDGTGNQVKSKPARLDVTAGIPQALTYLLSAPNLQSSCYGMVTNGREVLFLKCDRQQDQPQYMRSPTYQLIENTTERIQVLQGLKQIGTCIADLKG